MITRTFKITRVNAFCIHTKSHETFENPLALAGTYSTEQKLLKAAEKVLNTDDIKVVSLDAPVVEEKLFGMDEQFFLANAMELEPRKINEKR